MNLFEREGKENMLMWKRDMVCFLYGKRARRVLWKDIATLQFELGYPWADAHARAMGWAAS